MRGHVFGNLCKALTCLMAGCGAVVVIEGVRIPDQTIVAIGFWAILAAIWMLSKNAPIDRLGP